MKNKIIQSPLLALQTPLKAYRAFRMNSTHLSWMTIVLGCLFAYHSIGEAQAQPISSQSQAAGKQQDSASKPSSAKPSSAKPSPRALVEAQIIELKLALESSPNDLELLNTLAKLYIKLGDYPNALTHLKTSFGLNEKNEDISYLIAFTLRKLKRYTEAVETYRRFLTLAEDPKRLSGVFGLAKTLDLMGDPKGAYELYQEFVDQEARPSQKRWVEEAKSSMRRIQASEVVLVDTDTDEDTPTVQAQDAQKTKLATESLSTVLGKADQAFAQQQYKQAAELYLALSQRELPKPIQVKVIYSAAVCHYLLAQYKESKALAEQALAIDSLSPSLKGLAVLAHIQYKESKQKTINEAENLAQVRLAIKEGRLNNALAQINEYLAQAKQAISPIFLHAKGQVLLRMGKYSAAYQALKQAQKGLDYPHLHLDLARTARALRQHQKAEKHYNDLLNILNRSKISANSYLASVVSNELQALKN